MKKMMIYGMLATGLFIASCSENPATMPDGDTNSTRSDAGSISSTSWNPDDANILNLYFNGDAVSAYYRMNMIGGPVEMHSTDNVLYNYMVDSVFDANHELQTFIPVTNAYDDADKDLWRETYIVFNRGHEAHQFTSAAAIEAAAVGTDPEITLVPGTRMFLLTPVISH